MRIVHEVLREVIVLTRFVTDGWTHMRMHTRTDGYHSYSPPLGPFVHSQNKFITYIFIHLQNTITLFIDI